MTTMSTIQIEQKTVAVKGGVLAYEVGGDGAVVLCLPGLGDSRRSFERFAPALREAGYRVIATDLRGMGASRGTFASHSLRDLTDDITAILDAERATRAYIVGNSVSGASAGLFAIEQPERVRGLLLINPIVHTGGRFKTAMLVAALRTPGIGKSTWLSYFKTLYPKHPVEADYITHVQELMKQPGAMKSIGDMVWTPRLDARMTEINVPTLVFISSKDPDFADPRAEADQLRREMPRADVIVLDGLGHYPQREEPQSVLPRTLAWLKETV